MSHPSWLGACVCIYVLPLQEIEEGQLVVPQGASGGGASASGPHPSRKGKKKR